MNENAVEPVHKQLRSNSVENVAEQHSQIDAVGRPETNEDDAHQILSDISFESGNGENDNENDDEDNIEIELASPSEIIQNVATPTKKRNSYQWRIESKWDEFDVVLDFLQM